MPAVTNLRTIRKKLRSIENLKKITKAMQMVSAAKLKKTQDKLITLRNYENHLTEITNKVIASSSGVEDKWTSERLSGKTCTVVFSSEKGLCGTYNSNIYKFFDKEVSMEANELITCGRKIDAYSKKRNYVIFETVDSAKELSEERIFNLANKLIDGFINNKFAKVRVTYTKFVNVMTYRPSTAILLPFKINTVESAGETPIFEPEPKVLFDELIPYRVGTNLLLLYYESLVSEHAARMNAMKKATDNTDDLIKELVLVRNKVRQASITRELLDIVTGAEALKGED